MYSVIVSTQARYLKRGFSSVGVGLSWLNLEALVYSLREPSIEDVKTDIKTGKIVAQRLLMYNNIPVKFSYDATNGLYVNSLVSDNSDYQAATDITLGNVTIYELTGSSNWYTQDGATITI